MSPPTDNDTPLAGTAADPKLCEKCGRCCHSKLIIDGQVVYTPFPCPYLDEQTRLCTIYERRRELNPECMTVAIGIQLGLFPADCPYVRDLPDYVPPRMAMTVEEVEALAEEILAARDEAWPSAQQAGGNRDAPAGPPEPAEPASQHDGPPS